MPTRANFLRLLGLGIAGGFLGGRGTDICGSVGEGRTDEVEDIFSTSVIFDGVVNLGTERGKGVQPLGKGEIKKLTGLDLGNFNLRVSSMAGVNRMCGEHAESLMKIERARDIAEALKTGRYGLLYYTQQGFDLRGSVERLSEWKDEGLRSLQLTYNDNELGGGAGSDDRGLSALGKRVVAEMNRLRMVVDVSHSGRRTTLDAAAASASPITANHANALALTDHRRNKTDEELKAIAATGGVVGVTNINRFFLRDPRRPGTIDDFVSHVEYVVEKIGIDHVGISSDSHIDGSHRYDCDYSDSLMVSFARWRHVARRLMDRGYKREHLQKILGLNFKRVYETVLDP
ncbi:MAG: membrane dipeptidase [Acidobacteria bacterium]|nr:membrane dipeptidase [Acidobacteriota bacterium]MCW5969087.1 membrane dipeptidase [Blastocatellales bacterium]